MLSIVKSCYIVNYEKSTCYFYIHVQSYPEIVHTLFADYTHRYEVLPKGCRKFTIPGK